MSTFSVDVIYRPVRIGWCVNIDSFEQICKAIQYTTCLHGGCFNPIIPIESGQFGSRLIEQFKVDVLVSLCDIEEVKKNLPEHEYITTYTRLLHN